MSTDPFKQGVDIHFAEDVDWRAELADESDESEDDDSEEITPDVITRLGFDPRED